MEVKYVRVGALAALKLQQLYNLSHSTPDKARTSWVTIRYQVAKLVVILHVC